jgi:hypothetical protein
MKLLLIANPSLKFESFCFCIIFLIQSGSDSTSLIWFQYLCRLLGAFPGCSALLVVVLINLSWVALPPPRISRQRTSIIVGIQRNVPKHEVFPPARKPGISKANQEPVKNRCLNHTRIPVLDKSEI